MENAASPSRRETSLGWSWLLFQLLLLPSLLVAAADALPRAVTAAQINFVFYLLNFLAVCLIFRDFLKDSAKDARKQLRRMLSAAAAGLAAYYIGTWAVTKISEVLLPGFSNVNDDAISRMGAESWLLTAIGSALLAPAAEEMFYRGLIFRRLRPAGAWSAYALSALVFAAIHVVGYVGKFSAEQLLLCFVQYLPAGLCLAGAYEYSGTILTPILIHMIINARSAAALLIP